MTFSEDHSMEQQKKEDIAKARRKRIWKNVRSLSSTLIFVWLFTTGIAQATVVPSESMSPTIWVGDHFFIDKIAFPGNYPAALQPFLPTRTIHRGEIVAFWSPEDPDTRLVKRVIALPGETIEIRRRAVYINGSPLDEPYAVYTRTAIDANKADNFPPTVVPGDSFFMMGDNRDNSNDSRFWGFAPRSAMIGTPLFVYWSYESEPYGPGSRSLRETLEDYASVATHFLTRTRWSRTGTVLR
jgi:signal peptidase I